MNMYINEAKHRHKLGEERQGENVVPKLKKLFTTPEMLGEIKTGDEYKTQYGVTIYMDKDGNLRWSSTKAKATVSQDFLKSIWTKVDKPVDFMTAVNSGKQIRSEHWTYYRSLTYTLTQISYNDNNDIRSAEETINGKWYIEQ